LELMNTHLFNLKLSVWCVFAGLMTLCSCTPTVKVEAPEKPITINMNIKIDHEVRVKVEKDLDAVIGKDSKLF